MSKISAFYRGEVIDVPVDDITHFSCEYKYVIARCADGREFILDDALYDLEKRFQNEFIRTHRGHMVRRDLVESLNKDVSTYRTGTVTLRGVDNPIPVSRRNMERVSKFVESI